MSWWLQRWGLYWKQTNIINNYGYNLMRLTGWTSRKQSGNLHYNSDRDEEGHIKSKKLLSTIMVRINDTYFLNK